MQRAATFLLQIGLAGALIAAGGIAAAAPLDQAPQGAPRAAGCGGLKSTIKGSKGDDRGPDKLKGTAGNDVISAGRGADVVKAGAGDDFLCGGPGRDKLLGGPGVDTCNGGPGKDKLRGCEPGGGPPLPPGGGPPQPPTANPDSFDAIGNTGLFVGTTRPAGEAGKQMTGSLLANDTDPDTPTGSLVAEPMTNAPTDLGGTVTVEADGNFSYQPDDADSGGVVDTFTYRVCDLSPCNSGTTGNSTATVSLPIAGQVWYVRNNAAAGGDGTSDGPFDTLAEAEASSGAGDTVFVFDGDNTSTGYGGDGYAMNAAERLIGEHEGLVVDPDGGGALGSQTLFPANLGAHPTLTAINADAIDLDDGNEVRGFVVDPQGTGGGIAGSSGDTGGGTIDDVNVVDTGTAATQPGLELDSTTGTFNVSNLVVDNDATGVRLNNAGTVEGSGNAIDTITGTALNITDTDIGAGNLTLRSVSSNGAASGIVLSNTGPGRLIVTGNGNSSVGGDNSGGTIQGTTGFGISLTNTTNPSFTNVRLLNTGDSGINGTQVSGFTFMNGTITGAGDASDENSITFDDSSTNANVSGAVTIANNVISQTEAAGVDIQNATGTISDANISGNTLSDTGDVATPGDAVSLVASGSAVAAASITKGALSSNTITDFRAGAGFHIRGENPILGGLAPTVGISGSGTDVIAITGNFMNGGSGGVGNQPDRFVTASVQRTGQGNFNVSNNGSDGNRIRNIDCTAIELHADGPVTVTSTAQNNFINANSTTGCAGIAVSADDAFFLGAGTHTATISGNNVMGTDGPGIFPIVRNSGSTMTVKVLSNTVAAPNTTSAARAGIRVDSGSAAGDGTLCLEISGNTTAGSTNIATSTTSPGINLRKQGTDPAVNAFGIEGLSPSPTGSPNVENQVNSNNSSSSGTFGVNGTALLSATSGFTSCTAP